MDLFSILHYRRTVIISFPTECALYHHLISLAQPLRSVFVPSLLGATFMLSQSNMACLGLGEPSIGTFAIFFGALLNRDKILDPPLRSRLQWRAPDDDVDQIEDEEAGSIPIPRARPSSLAEVQHISNVTCTSLISSSLFKHQTRILSEIWYPAEYSASFPNSSKWSAGA